jgi:hypothetical protein
MMLAIGKYHVFSCAALEKFVAGPPPFTHSNHRLLEKKLTASSAVKSQSNYHTHQKCRETESLLARVAGTYYHIYLCLLHLTNSISTGKIPGSFLGLSKPTATSTPKT